MAQYQYYRVGDTPDYWQYASTFADAVKLSRPMARPWAVIEQVQVQADRAAVLALLEQRAEVKVLKRFLPKGRTGFAEAPLETTQPKEAA